MSRATSPPSGAPIEHHATVESTNDLARTRGLAGAPDGTTIVADAQTAGRGRRGRSWRSPPGVNLYLSRVVRIDPARAGLVPLLGAVAAREAIDETLGGDPQVAIKWPNDLLVRGEKLAGILAEWFDGASPFGVLGIGINVNATRADLPPDVRWPATSMALVAGRRHDRQALLARLLSSLEHQRELLQSDPEGLVARVRDHCESLGRKVRVHPPSGQPFEGIAARLDPDGVLVVQTTDRQIRVVAGDVDWPGPG